MLGPLGLRPFALVGLVAGGGLGLAPLRFASASQQPETTIFAVGVEATSEIGTVALGTSLVLSPVGFELTAELPSGAAPSDFVFDVAGFEVASELGTPATPQILVPVGLQGTTEIGTALPTVPFFPVGFELTAELGSVSLVLQTGDIVLQPSLTELASELGTPVQAFTVLASGVEGTTQIGTAAVVTASAGGVITPSGQEGVSELGTPILQLDLATDGFELTAEVGFVAPANRDITLELAPLGAPTYLIRTAPMDAVYLDNDWTFEYALSIRDTTTREITEATGLTGLVAGFALSPTGTIILPTGVVLVEATGLAGRYFAILDRAFVNQALTDYVGRQIYEVVNDGVSVRAVRALVVRDARPV